MSPRYLLLIGRDLRTRAKQLRLICERTGLQPVFSNEEVSALANSRCRCIPVAGAGCILGSLFRRHGQAKAIASLGSAEAQAIAESDGEALLGGYWGGYVAAITDGKGTRVQRDPSGTFSSYYVTGGDCALFASDAELLTGAGVVPEIEYEELGRQLYRAFVPSPATALRGIHELLAGFSVRVPAGVDVQKPCWSPWDHVSDRADPPSQAAERLERTVDHCVQSWQSTAARPLLSVSGGLDSSIIAASLAKTGADFVCLTMFADDPAGDERPFARALCEHLGVPLVERRYRFQDIDIAEPLAPHLPRPRERTQALAYERANLEIAAEVGADAFMTGNGGDNVFGYSQSAAPIADRYLADGVNKELVESIADVCRQTGCSVCDAVRQAWRLAHRPPSHRVRPNALFLDADFVAGMDAAELRHPWLEAPRDALPGKAAHVSAILRAQPTLEAARGYHLPLINPLLSQPIVETCLAIPSWEWRAGGRDRSLARRAFAARLPRAVLNRRVKGTPGRFAARLLDHFRGPIRERLLGGRLAAERIVDSAAIAELLAGERPISDLERVRILELVNCEAWIDHWTSRKATAQSEGTVTTFFAA